MKVGSFGFVKGAPCFGDLVDVLVHVLGVLRGHGGLERFEPFGDGCMVSTSRCTGGKRSFLGGVKVGIIRSVVSFGLLGWAEWDGVS